MTLASGNVEGDAAQKPVAKRQRGMAKRAEVADAAGADAGADADAATEVKQEQKAKRRRKTP